MKKILFCLFIVLLVALFVACGDDDEGAKISNDPKMIGRWEGYEGINFSVTTMTATTYEQLIFTNDSGRLVLSEESTKGNYWATNNIFSPRNTHKWSDSADNWAAAAAGTDNMAYTITGTGIGSVITLVTPGGTIFLTNVTAYTLDASLNGTWSNYQDVGGGTNHVRIITFGASGNVNVRETMTAIGYYTNVTKEISLGAYGKTAVSGITNLVEIRLTSRQEWTGFGGSLGSTEAIYDVMRVKYWITNSGSNLAIEGGLYLKQ